MRINLVIFAAAGLIASAASAQTQSTLATAQSSPTIAGAKTAQAPVVRTAKSLDCSKQADAKGLHGKPRKSFMSRCKKA